MQVLCINNDNVASESKRQALDIDVNLFKRMSIHAKKSPTYEEKSLKKLYTYELVWKIYYEAHNPQLNHKQIAHMMTYLHSTVLEFWDHQKETSQIWDKFIKWLRYQVTDPANYLVYATLRLKDSKQLKEQTVHNFTNYIKELEDDMPEMTSEEQKAWGLLNGLLPDIWHEIMQKNKTIMSWEQVIAVGQCQEKLTCQQSKSDEVTSSAPMKHRWFISEKHVIMNVKTQKDNSSSANQLLKNQVKDKKSKSKDKIMCYNCQKMRHILKNCIKSRKDNEKSKNEKILS